MYENFTTALGIFSKYEKEGSISAEHDIIYAGPSPSQVSFEDKVTLAELGWHESEYDCFYKFV